jgi:hypothetical protein
MESAGRQADAREARKPSDLVAISRDARDPKAVRMDPNTAPKIPVVVVPATQNLPDGSQS